MKLYLTGETEIGNFLLSLLYSFKIKNSWELSYRLFQFQIYVTQWTSKVIPKSLNDSFQILYSFGIC